MIGEQALDENHDLIDIERLDDVGNRAAPDNALHVASVADGAHHHERNRRIFRVRMQGVAEFEPGHDRHVEIADNQIRLALRDELIGDLAVFRGHDLKSGALQAFFHQTADQTRIVNHHNQPLAVKAELGQHVLNRFEQLDFGVLLRDIRPRSGLKAEINVAIGIERADDNHRDAARDGIALQQLAQFQPVHPRHV